jgi:hypothetical protein
MLSFSALTRFSQAVSRLSERLLAVKRQAVKLVDRDGQGEMHRRGRRIQENQPEYAL